MPEAALYRPLGHSGLKVSALGMGCWAIGGPWTMVDRPAGWGQVNDDESRRALQVALDLGITLFDTAANYGCGHSERLLGQVLAGRRDQVVIATKFGFHVDEQKRLVTPNPDVPGTLKQECVASLRRLNTDYIDLYQLHGGGYDPQRVGDVIVVLDELVQEGKIRWYGWSTENADGARVFARGEHCVAIQHPLNITQDAPAMLAVCAEFNLASLNRSPLAMGLFTGKFNAQTTFPEDDVRSGWNMQAGWQATGLEQLPRLRAVLTQDGRSLAQAALGWLWARSPHTIPIPGFKSEAQVRENVAAMRFGKLGLQQMLEIDSILGR